MTAEDRLSSADLLADLGDESGMLDGVEVGPALLNLLARARHRLDADPGALVVLVSRRFECLYDMLVSGGAEPPLPAHVVSDRALDGSLRDLTDQRVILLDDALVLGTTLTDLFDKITDRGGRPEAHVAFVDAERRNPQLVEHLGLVGHVDLSSNSIKQLAMGAARCLLRAGTPYFTDFPVFRSTKVTAALVEDRASHGGWRIVDVSSKFHDDAGIRAVSMVPAGEWMQRTRQLMAPEVAELLTFAKVRMYLDVDERRAARIVPIGIPREVRKKRLQRAIDALQLDDLLTAAWDERAKHRLVQMMMSAAVARTGAEFLGLSVPDLGEFDAAHLERYFGSQDEAAVVGNALRTVLGRPREQSPAAVSDVMPPRSDLAALPKVRAFALDNSSLLNMIQDAAPEPIIDTGRGLGAIDPTWTRLLLEIFGEVDSGLEVEQQRQLQAISYEEYREYRDAGAAGVAPESDALSAIGPRVLRQSITMSELAELSFCHLDLDGTLVPEVLVSFIIDVGNDLGIVVPTTVSDVTVGRRYRSGENAWLVTPAVRDAPDRDPEHLPLGKPSLDGVRAQVAFQPGRLCEDRVGTVSEVEGEALVAEYRSMTSDPTPFLARISLSRFPEAARQQLQVGNEVRWQIRLVPQPDGSLRDEFLHTTR